jgi:hypothetical protein
MQQYFLLWLVIYAVGIVAIVLLLAYSMRLRYFSVRKKLHREPRNLLTQLTRFSNHKNKINAV